MKFRELYEEANKVYSYSSLQFNFNEDISSKVLNFSKIYIPDSYLYFDDSGDCGRESQIHCTVLYGIESSTAYQVRGIINKFKDFEVTLGNITFFEKDDCDVMKIDVNSDYLKEINSIIRSKIDYQNHYNDYIPHCTIAYLQKGVKENLKYDEKYFNGINQTIKELEFASKDGSREMIQMRGN